MEQRRNVLIAWTCLLFCSWALSGASLADEVTSHGDALFGRLETPGYPGPYGDNLDLTWNVTMPAGYLVGLDFSLFQLEPSRDCGYDYVKIISQDQEMHTFCGNDAVMDDRVPPIGVQLTSADNSMIVQFHSDFSNEAPFVGFIAHYRAIDIDECSTNNGGCQHTCINFISGYFCTCRKYYQLGEDLHTCEVSCSGQVFTSETDVLETPDYPNDYPNNVDCSWLIVSETGYTIHIIFETLQIETHPEVVCPYDYVMIYDNNQTSGPYCGANADLEPLMIESTSNIVNITFHSDDSEQGRGFQARYFVKGKRCPPLPEPLLGTALAGNLTYRQTVTFDCRLGYFVNGTETRICHGDGTWSGVQPTCDLVTCRIPPVLSNGRIIYHAGQNRSYTNTIGYECNPYYELQGLSVRSCEADGEWSGPQHPLCIPICGVASFAPRNHISESRVAGGREATVGSWPWQALLEVYAPLYDFVDNSICGGSLVNEEWLLTAAHCVTGNYRLRPMFFGESVPTESVTVIVGLHSRSDPSQHAVVNSVREIIKHPDYNPSTYDADVALIRLNRSVQFNDHVRPICLPKQNSRPPNTPGDDDRTRIRNVAARDMTGVVIGWGRRDESAPTSNNLREVYVGVDVTRNNCRRAMSGEITTNMVCAGPREGGQDACTGDSGGPLMLQHATTRRYFPYGLVSWGEGCADEGKFGVYVRVENFVDWIESNARIER